MLKWSVRWALSTLRPWLSISLFYAFTILESTEEFQKHQKKDQNSFKYLDEAFSGLIVFDKNDTPIIVRNFLDIIFC
jgi:hypothetical protein